MEEQTVVLGGRSPDGFSLNLELLLDPARSAEPEAIKRFVTLGGASPFSRVLLGRINFGHRSSSRHVAVKLQTAPSDQDDPLQEGERLNHAILDRRFSRELEHHLAFADRDDAGAAVYFLQPTTESSPRDEPRSTFPPLLFCTEALRLFPIFSRRGTALSTCRDEELLAQRGLDSYGESTRAWIYNKEDYEAGEEPLFYRLAADSAPDRPGGGGLDDCLEQQSLIAGMAGQDPPEVAGAADFERLGRLFAGLPCLSCPKKDECYPDGEYRNRLVPFTPADANVLIMELNRFGYDEFCDLLGGIGEADFERKYVGPSAETGRKLRLEGVEELFQPGRRYMFDAEGFGADALEIFRLKWTAIKQICESVHQFHRRCGAPHLKLDPQHVMIQLAPSGKGLPVLWQFKTCLVSLGSPVLEPSPEQGETESIPLAPGQVDPLYTSEIIKLAAPRGAQRGVFTLGKILPAEGSGVVLEAVIEHEGISAAWLSEKDRVEVVLSDVGSGVGELSFFALRAPETDYSPDRLELRSRPLQLIERQIAGLEQVLGSPVHNCRFRVYPYFHVPCDIYSLGMLLFRTLLVNDEHGMGEVSQALVRLRQCAEAIETSDYDEDQEADLWDALLESYDRDETARIFGRWSVFYNREERDPSRPNAIARDVWAKAMILGLRMITSIEGFGVCSHHGDFDLHYPAGKIEPIVHKVDEILREIDSALLAMHKRNVEIRAAVDSVLAPQAAAPVADGSEG